MHCSLYQAAQEVEKCWDVKPSIPSTICYLLSFSPFLSPPCTHLIGSLEVLSQHDLFSVVYLHVFSPAGESVRFGEGNISWGLCVIVCSTQIYQSRCAIFCFEEEEKKNDYCYLGFFLLVFFFN